MPEASIDEDRDLQPHEHYVWTHPRDPRDCRVNAVPESASVEDATKTHLLIGVTATDGLHPSANKRIRRFV